jgi:MFS family permease
MTDAPAAQPYTLGVPAPQAPRSPRLGRVALIMAASVIGLSLVASLLIGLFATTIYVHDSLTTSGTHLAGGFSFNAQPSQGVFGIQFALGSIFGIWALVQGIVATVQNRGRRFGVIAIVLAGSAPLLSAIVWGIVGGIAGHHVTQ